MKKPTLLVLAAGMGSRFGGLKQMAQVGPGGETLLDYAVHDARRAGFGKIVFVIRPDFAEVFREKVVARMPSDLEIELAYQELSQVPEGATVPAGREKPWGTGHAVLAARGVINEPFAVINADDYYGAEAYALAAEFFRAMDASRKPLSLALVAFRLGRTLSPHGTVSRGICEVDANGNLAAVTETTGLRREAPGRIISDLGSSPALGEDTPVSMNFFAFAPEVFEFLAEEFERFFAAAGTELKSEFYLPTAIANMIDQGNAAVRVLSSATPWMGVTYADDRPAVEAALAELHQSGAYQSPLW